MLYYASLKLSRENLIFWASYGVTIGMSDLKMREMLTAILTLLEEYYPETYVRDGMNPPSNRVAGFIMNEIRMAEARKNGLIEG